MSHVLPTTRPHHRPTAHARTRGAIRAAVALVATLTVLLLGSTAASAHDRLDSTTPKDGATVATAPTEVVLTFSDDVVAVGTEIVVNGPDGDVQQGRPRIDGTTVSQSLAPGSAPGKYTVTWRATSKDGHPVSGTFGFTATSAGASVPSRTTATSDPVATPSASSDAAAATSSTSTGESDQGGTSWALWLVLAVLVLAGAGAAAVRVRRGHADRGQG